MRKQSCSWLPAQTGKSLDACTRVIWFTDPAKPDIQDIVSLSDCRQIRSPDGRPASLTPCKLYFDLDCIQLQLHASPPAAAPLPLHPDAVTATSSAATCCSTGMHWMQQQHQQQGADCERISKSESVDGKEGVGGGGGCSPSSPSEHHSLKSCTLSSPKSSSCSSSHPSSCSSSSAHTSVFIPCFFFSDPGEEEIRRRPSAGAAVTGDGGAKIELHKISILSAAKNIELYQRGEDWEQDDERGDGGEGSASAASPLAGDEGRTCWQNNSRDRSSSFSTNSAEKEERSDEYVTTARGELIEDADGEFMFSASVQIDMGKSVRRFRINLIPRQASTTASLWIFGMLIEIRGSAPPLSSSSSLTGDQRFRESLAQNITPSSSAASSSQPGRMANRISRATFPDLLFMSTLMHQMSRGLTAERAVNRLPRQDGGKNNKSNRVVGEQKKQQDGECNLSQAAFPVQPFSSSSSVGEEYSCGSVPSPSSSSLPFPFSSYLPTPGPSAATALASMTGTMHGSSLSPDIRSPPPPSSLTAGRTSANDHRMHRPLTDTDTPAAAVGAAHDAVHQDAAFDVHVDHGQETCSDEGAKTGKLSFHQNDYQHSNASASGRNGEERRRECDTCAFPPASLGSSVSSAETPVVQSGQLRGRVSDVTAEREQERHANHFPHRRDQENRSHCQDGDDHLSRLMQDLKQFLHHGFNQVSLRLDQMDDRIGRIEGHLLQQQREQQNQ